MDISLHDVVVGVVGLGMLVKGLSDQASVKRGGVCDCQFKRADMEHIDNMFELLNIKLEKLKNGHK